MSLNAKMQLKQKMSTLSNDLFVIAKIKCDSLIKYKTKLLHTLANWDVCSELKQFSKTRLLNKWKSSYLRDFKVWRQCWENILATVSQSQKLKIDGPFPCCAKFAVPANDKGSLMVFGREWLKRDRETEVRATESGWEYTETRNKDRKTRWQTFGVQFVLSWGTPDPKPGTLPTVVHLLRPPWLWPHLYWLISIQAFKFDLCNFSQPFNTFEFETSL